MIEREALEANYEVLVINPGSTSTKIGYFNNGKMLFSNSIIHSPFELSSFQNICDQFSFRKQLIINELQQHSIALNTLKAVIGRGGLVKPISSGTYIISEALKKDLREGYLGQHASNLGGLIADEIASEIPGAIALIADPVVVDELQDVARFTGHPLFNRISIFHALNQKAVARMYAQQINKPYESLNLIVAHLGGGISIGAHKKGLVIDVNNGLDGDGPFAPERSGTLPTGQIIDLCFSGKYAKTDLLKMVVGQGGLMAYLGTNDVREVSKRIEKGDKLASDILDAMCYQIGQWIGAMSAVLHGDVDAILLTGGIAYNQRVTDYIKQMCLYIAPIEVFAGEDELRSLAECALRVLKGEEEAKEYI
jgi:butyrate kinase